MSTLAIRAPAAPKQWAPLRPFARAASLFMTVLQVFAEAQDQAHQAQQRYPFITW